jgi:hypothetical protein
VKGEDGSEEPWELKGFAKLCLGRFMRTERRGYSRFSAERWGMRFYLQLQLAMPQTRDSQPDYLTSSKFLNAGFPNDCVRSINTVLVVC